MSDKIIRTVTGVVVSDIQDKTIVVKVERKLIESRIGKVIKRSAKMHAHDESNTCKVGDIVIIRESRPLSKKKTWVLEKVLKSVEVA